MAELDITTVRSAFDGIKGAIKDKIEIIPGAGNVHPRIRYAADLQEWLRIASIERTAGIEVIRCAFIYLTDWNITKVEGCLWLYEPMFSIEVLQGFEDGTDEDNSTLTYEHFLADAIESFTSDLYLGFTEGDTEVTHTGLQGGGGDNRPALIDGVFAHRKVLTLQAQFKRR